MCLFVFSRRCRSHPNIVPRIKIVWFGRAGRTRSRSHPSFVNNVLSQRNHSRPGCVATTLASSLDSKIYVSSQRLGSRPGCVAPTLASSPALKYLAWSRLAAKGTRCHLSFVVPRSKTERNKRMTCLARKLLCHIDILASVQTFRIDDVR